MWLGVCLKNGRFEIVLDEDVFVFEIIVFGCVFFKYFFKECNGVHSLSEKLINNLLDQYQRFFN
mgnify:CR=1 FL=1